ncbi:MAG TPA: hypothetical protein VN756_12975 [Solirubrobacterales bacterium]|nr:hypothetical protein [Solirubrobacterales bacterium]
MSAGLPGLGLGGLFFIISALLAPFRQLLQTFRGRSRAGEWAMVGRQFAQATVMVAAIDLSLRLAYLAIAAAGLGNTPSAVSGTVIPLTLIGITSALLIGVLATAKSADIVIRLRAAELPRVPDVLPRATPLRTLALSGVVALAWLALLVAGASELSPLESPRREGTTTKQRADDAQAPKSNLARSEGRPQTDAISGPASASPRPSDAGQPVAEPDREINGSEAGIALQPAVSTPAPPSAPPTHQEQTAPAAPPVGAPSPPPVSPGSEPPSVANPPHATGPPASAGPPEGLPAPEHAGPSERSTPPHEPSS